MTSDSIIASSVKRTKILPSPLLSGPARSLASAPKQPDITLQGAVATDEEELLPPPAPSSSPPPDLNSSPPPDLNSSPPPLPSSTPPDDEVDNGHMVDTSVQAQVTTDIQLEGNAVTMSVEGVSEPSNSDNVTVTTTEKQVSNRKMVHSLKLSPLAMTVATAEITRTHSDYQIYKAGVLLKPLNKCFQSDDTLNMDTGIALASSTPVQSLLAKKTTFVAKSSTSPVANSNISPVANSNGSPVANSNTSPVANSNNPSTISSNISNHIVGEDPGYATISEVSPAGLHKDDHSNENNDHMVDGNTSESNATSDHNDEDPGYSIIAEVLPNKEDLPVPLLIPLLTIQALFLIVTFQIILLMTLRTLATV